MIDKMELRKQEWFFVNRVEKYDAGQRSHKFEKGERYGLERRRRQHDLQGRS